jgi:tripartite-type tricarboxylate transporter receptor subunit TctC
MQSDPMSKHLRLLTAVSFAALPVFASAQKTADTFPTRPIRMLVAQAAGGPTDIVARVFATRSSASRSSSTIAPVRAEASRATSRLDHPRTAIL